MKINDTHAESSLLASILTCYNEEKAKGMTLQAMSEIDESFFYDQHNAVVYVSMVKSYKNGFPLDIHSVSNFLLPEMKTSGVRHITNLVSLSTSPKIDKYLEIMKRLHTARRLKQVCISGSSVLENSSEVLEDIENVERDMTDAMLAGVVRRKDEGFISEYLGEYFETLQRQMSGNNDLGIPTGIEKLDNVTGGLKRGDLITVAGRTGMGKSSLIATWIAFQLKAGFKVALFTFELQRKAVVDKTISILSEMDGGMAVPFSVLNNPAGHFGGASMSSRHLERVSEITAKYISNSVFFVRGKSKMKVEEGIAICRKLKQESKIDIAYFDHIGLMVQDKNNAVSELSNITGSLLLFAGEMNIPVVEVAQLNRSADTANEKPKLSHLKGSGSIEEDSNVVIMPWRPYAINREGNPEECEIIVAKSRDTGTGEIPSRFSTVSTMFCNVSEEENRYGEPEEGYRF